MVLPLHHTPVGSPKLAGLDFPRRRKLQAWVHGACLRSCVRAGDVSALEMLTVTGVVAGSKASPWPCCRSLSPAARLVPVPHPSGAGTAEILTQPRGTRMLSGLFRTSKAQVGIKTLSRKRGRDGGAMRGTQDTGWVC